MINWSIDTSDGEVITEGLSEHDVFDVAQRIASERGESVYAYRDHKGQATDRYYEVEP